MELSENVKVEILKIVDRDILVIKLDEDYYTPENANYTITAVKEALAIVADDKKVGIIVVRQPNEIGLMDDDMLLNLGLVKLGRMADSFTEDEMLDFMIKLGFEKTLPYQKVPNSKEIESDKHTLQFIVHTNEENSFEEMIKLYEVNISECIERNNFNIDEYPDKDYFHLYPRLDNKYKLPIKKGR